jgi:hypothetical protein
MAIGIRCDTCGAEAPSLGSLQMHQLRYHSTSSGPSGPSGPSGAGAASAAQTRARSGAGGPAPRNERDRSRPRNGRNGAIAPLALAVVALLSGGAFAATRPRTETTRTRAELQAAAHRAVLTSADFPAGWTANPSDPTDNEGDDGDRALAECMGTTYEDSPTEAESSFSSAGLSANSDVTIASSVERARADFAALAGPTAPGCFEQVMRKRLDADKPVDGSYDVKVTLSDLAGGLPKDADRDAVGLRVAVTLHRGKATVPLTFEAVMLRYDRIEATVTFTSVGDPGFPTDLARSLTDAVVQRLANPA